MLKTIAETLCQTVLETLLTVQLEKEIEAGIHPKEEAHGCICSKKYYEHTKKRLQVMKLTNLCHCEDNMECMIAFTSACSIKGS